MDRRVDDHQDYELGCLAETRAALFGSFDNARFIERDRGRVVHIDGHRMSPDVVANLIITTLQEPGPI